MQISDERIDDFISRWERAFGERLTRETARPIADRLLFLCRRLRRPLPAATMRLLDGYADRHEPEAS